MEISNSYIKIIITLKNSFLKFVTYSLLRAGKYMVGNNCN